MLLPREQADLLRAFTLAAIAQSLVVLPLVPPVGGAAYDHGKIAGLARGGNGDDPAGLRVAEIADGNLLASVMAGYHFPRGDGFVRPIGHGLMQPIALAFPYAGLVPAEDGQVLGQQQIEQGVIAMVRVAIHRPVAMDQQDHGIRRCVLGLQQGAGKPLAIVLKRQLFRLDAVELEVVDMAAEEDGGG